jgi:predicted tellurium resistance membrane protein TerC
VLATAWLGRTPGHAEAGWLAYPLLGLIGLKMLLEDLPRGRPVTLILAFAFYGLALILVPRIRARRTAVRDRAEVG